MNENTNTAFVPTEAEQKRMQEEGRKSSMLFGIAAGAVMLVIGLPAVFSPLAVGVTLAYMVTAGLGVYGITQIAAWAKTPAEQRGSAVVVSGMFLTGFSLLTLWASFQTRFSFAGLIAGLSVAVAFFTVLQGISQFFLFSEMREAGTEGAGWVLAGGVLNAFLGIVILTNPLVSWFAISTVWGIYLSVSGIALVAESLSGHRGRRGDA